MSKIKLFCLWALLLISVCSSFAWAAECDWPTCSMPTIRGLDHYVDVSSISGASGADAVAGIVVYDWQHKYAFGYIVMYQGEVVYYGGP